MLLAARCSDGCWRRRLVVATAPGAAGPSPTWAAGSCGVARCVTWAADVELRVAAMTVYAPTRCGVFAAASPLPTWAADSCGVARCVTWAAGVSCALQR
uniref:Putative secreted protein n=1 Tax=Anopheles marajoara TaxID=58244 RepID=A0A2M4C8Y7_9DIPT